MSAHRRTSAGASGPFDRNIAPFNCWVVLIRTTPGSVGMASSRRNARSAYPPLVHRDSTGWGTVAVDEAWISHLRVVPPEPNIALFNRRVVRIRTTPVRWGWRRLDGTPVRLIHPSPTATRLAEGTVAVDEAWISHVLWCRPNGASPVSKSRGTGRATRSRGFARSQRAGNPLNGAMFRRRAD